MASILTVGRFHDARDYLLNSGRRLEQELFRYHFEGGDSQAALRELGAYQMPDGGFRAMGEGTLTDSSPAGTACAFQILTELSAPADDPLVQKGIGYLLSSYDSVRQAWPRNQGDAANLSEESVHQWGNPDAEIIGYLRRYSEHVPKNFLDDLIKLAMRHFRRLPRVVPGFIDLCYLRLAQTLPDDAERTEILRRVAAGVRENLELDHTRWQTGYFIKPYWYAMQPADPLHELLQEELDACLDFDIATQETDGSARLTFKATGDEARMWKSIWTLESLKALRNYGRIATASGFPRTART